MWPRCACLRVDPVQRGDAPGAVHHTVGQNVEGLTVLRRTNDISTVLQGHPGHFGVKVNRDAKIPRVIEKHVDEIRLEALQRALTAVEDRHPGASAGSQVSKLERDVAAADEGQLVGENIQLQKLSARCEMLGAVDGQGRRLCPRWPTAGARSAASRR